jgi:hypothetical protein
LSLLPPSLQYLDTIKAADHAWFKNIHKNHKTEELMSSFESIENMTIERFYTKFQGSEGDPKYRIANIG